MLDSMDKQHLTVVIMKEAPKSPGEALRARQGKRIADFRKYHKLSQTDLAEKVGVTKAAVSEWERGKSSPRQHHQVAIARALRTPWSALFNLDADAEVA